LGRQQAAAQDVPCAGGPPRRREQPLHARRGRVRPQKVDEIWKEYERGLSNAIGELIAGRVDARTWARILIPFVACMLVRGPDFADRFERRMAALEIDDIDGVHTADNVNMARLFELQRLLGPVAAAKWVVLEFPREAHS
jgi:hypothetical protein